MKAVYEFLELSAEKYPNKIAIKDDTASITYNELLKNSMIFDFNKFIRLDREIQTKLIEFAYKFFNPKKPFLRYKKIINVHNRLSDTATLNINIGSMRVRKNNKFVFFLT